MMEFEKIVDEHQEEICKHCYQCITDGFRVANGWLCEGSYCKEATESFFDIYSWKLRKYKLKKIEKTY